MRNKTSETKWRSDERNTLIVTICTFISRILGFARVGVISAIFGASGIADVLNLVLQLPNNLRRLLAEGALSSALIPTLNQEMTMSNNHHGDPRLFIRTVFGAQLLFFLPLLITASLCAPYISNWLFDFQTVSLQAHAQRLFAMLIWYIFPLSIGAMLMAVCNSHGRFLAPSLTPICSSVVVIITTILLHQSIGIYAVGIGIIIGGMMHIIAQLPTVYRLRYTLKPAFRFRNKVFGNTMRNWVPILITSSLFAINQQIAVYFASGLHVGSGSIMIYALTFWQLPFGILAVSTLTVLYPRMSNEYARGDYHALRISLRYGIRYLIVVMVPATLYLIIMSDFLVGLALQRGAFTADDTIVTADVLRAYSYGLIGVALYQFFQRFFYANRNMHVPVILLCMVMCIDVALSLWLKEIIGVSGLAYANTIAFTIGAMGMLWRAKRTLRKYLHNSYTFIDGWWRVMISVIVAGIPLALYRYYLHALFDNSHPLIQIAIFGAISIIFVGIVSIAYTWLGVDPHPLAALKKIRRDRA